MNDKASLLGQLRIDRTNDGGGDSVWKWWTAGGAAVLVLAGGLWVALAAPGGVAVKAATVKPAAGGAATGASLLDASGYVVARRQATVSSKITGKVRDVSIEEGQRVEKDQIIAHLDDSNALAALAQAEAQVVQAQANLRAAEAAYGNAQPVHERNKNLQANGTISNGALDLSRANYDAARTGLDVARSGLKVSEAALAAAQQFEDDTAIRAPFSGVITVKAAQPGEMVSPVSAGGGFTRTGIGTIVDMDSLEVEVDVSEAFISRVHAGQAAAIKLNAYPDWQIPGELIAVIPTADRAKATVKVRVGFKEKDNRVVPEMGARVSFLGEAPAAGAPAAAPGTLVPAEAVQANGDVGVVFLIKDKTVERRTVRLGARSPDGQVVLSGISAGDKVAVADLSLLSDGAKIHIEP
jgi:RND family efflux transporter MFP subunit